MVSIIIPVFNQWEFTKKCLFAIEANTKEIEYEIIVIDDCSTDETQTYLSTNPNVKYFFNKENEGFIKSSNKGAEYSQGNFLVFLNNDTEVQEKWLNAILEIFEKNEDAGIVGSKLISSDGSLQEAGCIVWNDGSARNYGRGEESSDWQFNNIREVDYVSGACLAIRREVWTLCNGFDELYLPAYYEDVDICFATRSFGYKVYYQPQSIVIHHEGVTSGKSVFTGVKKHQVINKQKFSNKWKSVLETNHWPPDLAFLFRAKWNDIRPMLLIVDHKVPEPDKDAGSVRMWNIILLLMKKGFRVTFFPNSKPNYFYSQNLMDIGVEVVEHFRAFEDLIIERSLQFDIVWLARPDVAINKIDKIRKIMPNTKIIYDTIDLHFIRTKRQSELEENKSIALFSDAYKAEELYICDYTDITVVVTEEERNILINLNSYLDPVVIPCFYEIPEHDLHGAPYDERKGMMFLGGFGHPPNVDAVIWFINEILPLIRKKIDDVVFYVIGSNPKDEILSLHNDSDVEIIGWVDDLEPWFKKTRIFVSPLRYGAGIKGKNIQAMSYALPTVTTSIGAEGINLSNRINSMIADSAEEFAQAVIELYQTPELWQKLSTSSVAHISKTFSKTHIETVLDQLFLKLFDSTNNVDFIRTDIQRIRKQVNEKISIEEFRRKAVEYSLKQGYDRPVFIWGAGVAGTRTLAFLHEIGIDVEGFIDTDISKQATIVESKAVFSPDVLVNDSKPFVIVGTTSKFSIEIIDRLMKLGYAPNKDFCSAFDIKGRR